MKGHVVLVHGIFDSGAVFRRMARFLETRGFVVHAPSLIPNSGALGLEDLAHKLTQFIDSSVGESERFNLIGFSMGGLISRYYVQRLSGGARVRRLITISTPHHGSRMAHLLRSKACVQMRPGSEFLNDLNADAHTLEQLGIVSMWTPLDLMIIPARSSHLPVATEIKLPILLHPLMLSDRRSLAAIANFLDEG